MSTTTALDNENPKALFSLEESKSFYWIAVDMPGLSDKTEIVAQNNELLVRGEQTFFRCRTKDKKIKASYQNGVLWLLLPKLQPKLQMEGEYL